MLKYDPASMPFYRFHVDTPEPPPVVAEKLKAIIGASPGFWESFSMGWRRRDPSSPPFIGSVQGNSFNMRRDIRYRNSFLPVIRGRAESEGIGTRVSVTMFLHPLVAGFMALWSAIMASVLAQVRPSWLWLFLAFAVVVVLAGFVPEAIKAKRLITNAVLRASRNGVYLPANPIP